MRDELIKYDLPAYRSCENKCTLSQPADVQNFTATTINSRQIDLVWEKQPGIIEYYLVERKLEGENNYAFLVEVDSSKAKYSDNDLLPSKKVYYRIRAYNCAGYSPGYTEATVTTK